MSWKRVRNHEQLIQAFADIVRGGRLGHAYLFVGPPGVGKRLFAHELAKTLLCEGRGDKFEACNRCPACLQAEADAHPDLVVAGRPEDALEIPIEAVRDVCRRFGLKPARGHGKVAIIDNADDLSDISANCFLKTLEEPPPRSTLLLIGSSTDRQLPTILSRCQVVHFGPLSDELVSELLGEQGIEDAVLRERLVQMARGSVGDALALADPSLWEFRRQFLTALAQEQPDTVAIASQWTRFVEDAGKESAAQRRRAALVLRLLIEFLGQALGQSVGEPSRPGAPEDQPLIAALASRLGTERLLELLERCLQADQQIERRVQLVLVLEALVDALGRNMAVARG